MLNDFNKLSDLGDKEAPWILIFNKLSGVYIGSLSAVQDEEGNVTNEDEVNQTHCKTKVVTMDPKTQVWVGDFDTGEVQYKEQSQRKITEAGLDGSAGTQIKEQYQYHNQLNVISDLLEKVVAQLDLPEEDTNAFYDMREFIQEVRDINVRYKEAYEQDPHWEYINKEDETDIIDAQLAGGLSEVIGGKARGVA